MIKYIFIFLLIVYVANSYDHKFTESANYQDTYLARQNEYFIEINKDSLIIYKFQDIFYKANFQNCDNILLSDLDSFRVYRYYDYNKEDTLLFYSNIKLLSPKNDIISEINVSKEEISINANKRVFSINLMPKENFLANKLKLNIAWSSYYGGATSLIDMKQNSKGEIIIVGNSTSPQINGHLPLNNYKVNSDIVIIKLSQTGEIIWLTFIGSTYHDYVYSLAIDKNDKIWISGEARNGDFFLKKPLFDKFKGGTAEGVICQFNDNGTAEFSTFIGGNNYDAIAKIGINYDGKIWACGRSTSSDFPLSYDAEFNKRNAAYNGVLICLNEDYSLQYSTFINYSSIDNSVTVDFYCDNFVFDRNGNIIIAGTTNCSKLPSGKNDYENLNNSNHNAFISKFDINGKIQWSKFIKGKYLDYANCLAIDNSDNIIINVITYSTDMICQGDSDVLRKFKSMFIDNFLVKLNSEGDLIWSGYIGGNGNNGEIFGDFRLVRGDIKTSSENDIFYTFYTQSSDLIVNEFSAFDEINSKNDAYFIILDSNANYKYSTYLGGNQDDLPSRILISNNAIYLAGYTNSNNFPIINNNSKYHNNGNDGFVICFDFRNNPPKIMSKQTDKCFLNTNYIIFDNNTISGFKPIEIEKNINCNITHSINKDTCKIFINKINNNENAYFRIKITNFADETIIIEDSLLTSADAHISFEPSDLIDFGNLSIYENRNCQKIKILNNGNSDFTFDNAFFKENINFSFPVSQLPLTIPANSTKEFIICVSPHYLSQKENFDTLLIWGKCNDFYLAAKVVYDFTELNSETKCSVPINIQYDSVKYFSHQSIISNQDFVDIELENSKKIDVSIYNSLATRINYPKIKQNSNWLNIDFRNISNGVYYIYIESENNRRLVKLLLIR